MARLTKDSRSIIAISFTKRNNPLSSLTSEKGLNNAANNENAAGIKWEITCPFGYTVASAEKVRPNISFNYF